MSQPKLSRRHFLVAGGAGVGLVVAYNFWPRQEVAPWGTIEGESHFGHYLTIRPDGQVTASLAATETGQGIWTGLAQLIADELGARLDQVGVQPIAPGLEADNALFANLFDVDPIRVTAAATSFRAYQQPVRETASVARQMLAAEAAARWNVDAAEVIMADGFASAGPHRITIGELAEAAASRHAPSPKLRPWGKGGIAGRNRPRIDTREKASGRWRFASDIRLPGMAYATIRIAPANGELRPANGKKSDKVRWIERDGWIAAVGDSWWAVEEAMRAADIGYHTRRVTNAVIAERLARSLDERTPRRLAETGDIDEVMEEAEQPISGRFNLGAWRHRGLEPVSATANPTAEGVQVWAASQAPDAAREAIAKATGLGAKQVQFLPMAAGSGDGRALEADAAAIAAVLALEIKRPVQLIIAADHAMRHDPVGPPMLADVAAVPGSDGRIEGWQARVATGPGMAEALERLTGETARSEQVALIPPYGIANMSVEQVDAELGVKTGYHRGAAAAMHGFINEVMVDGVARATGSEPLAYRIGMAGHDPRLTAVIARVAERAKWDGGGAGSKMGIAAASIDNSRIACIAEAEGSALFPTIHRLIAVVDCGLTANPELVQQQVEAGLLAALHQALLPAPKWQDGFPLKTENDRGMGAMASLPAINVEVLASDHPPGGVSQLGFAVGPAAVANALAAGGRKGLRNLPFAGESGA